MTTIDASIPLGVKPVQIESPINQLANIAQLQGAQTQNQLLQLKMDEAQRAIADQNALRAGLSEPNADVGKVLLGRGMVDEYTKWQKAPGDAAKQQVELLDAKLKQSRQFLDGVSTPQEFMQWHQANHADPIIGPALAARGITPEKSMARIQQMLGQPGGLQQLINEAKLGSERFMELNKPTTTTVGAGGTSQMFQTPGLGGPPQLVGTVQHTATPGELLTDTRARSEGAANRAQQLRLHNDTVANENLRAGVGPGGALDANAERTAQGIASGQLPAPTGMALLNPKNQRILGRVMEINPQYDSTTVAAKAKAARDFTTGQLGNSMRSFQVAGQHLDQLGQLVDALDNKNLQIVNKIGNAYATQTGNPAPTNFEAAKDVVSKEVVKAIVAGGGGVTERQELSNLMSQAKSPAQLKGVIQQYRNLMAAQHDALLQQRDAAGLPRSTLPNYNEPGGGGTAGTAGWTVIGVQPAGRK